VSNSTRVPGLESSTDGDPEDDEVDAVASVGYRVRDRADRRAVRYAPDLRLS
jgi:hypothetical protein